uniref:LysM domain containing 2 n=1 Tax=Propithecus coquereli TaxID=379532 RepID=A0A2K6ER32_PROCO
EAKAFHAVRRTGVSEQLDVEASLRPGPENETVDSSFSHEEEPVVAGEDLPPPSPQESDVQPSQPEEVSARDFLQRLDLQIKLSTQAAKKLKEESRSEESPYATSLYHS